MGGGDVLPFVLTRTTEKPTWQHPICQVGYDAQP